MHRLSLPKSAEYLLKVCISLSSCKDAPKTILFRRNHERSLKKGNNQSLFRESEQHLLRDHVNVQERGNCLILRDLLKSSKLCKICALQSEKSDCEFAQLNSQLRGNTDD